MIPNIPLRQERSPRIVPTWRAVGLTRRGDSAVPAFRQWVWLKAKYHIKACLSEMTKVRKEEKCFCVCCKRADRIPQIQFGLN